MNGQKLAKKSKIFDDLTDPFQQTKDGWTTLMECCKLKDVAGVMKLILAGADINQDSMIYPSALEYCAEMDWNEGIVLLSNSGLDQKSTALSFCCYKSNNFGIKTLLESKANPNKCFALNDDPEIFGPPIFQTVWNNNLEGFNLLIDAKASVDEHFYNHGNKTTLFQEIIDVGNEKMFRLAMRRSKDTKLLSSPLTDACRMQKMEFVKIMLENKTPIQDQTMNFVCKQGSLEMIKFFELHATIRNMFRKLAFFNPSNKVFCHLIDGINGKNGFHPSIIDCGIRRNNRARVSYFVKRWEGHITWMQIVKYSIQTKSFPFLQYAMLQYVQREFSHDDLQVFLQLALNRKASKCLKFINNIILAHQHDYRIAFMPGPKHHTSKTLRNARTIKELITPFRTGPSMGLSHDCLEFILDFI